MSATHIHHHQAEDPEYWTRMHSEHVVLDIGDDIGALVLYTPPEFHGQEIELGSLAPGAPRIHSAVLERRVAGRTLFAAVYPELRPGTYRFWVADPEASSRSSPGGSHGPIPTATVVAGRVAEVDWR